MTRNARMRRARRWLTGTLALLVAIAALISGATRRLPAVQEAMPPGRLGPGRAQVGVALIDPSTAAPAQGGHGGPLRQTEQQQRGAPPAPVSTGTTHVDGSGSRPDGSMLAMPGTESLARWRSALAQRAAHPADVVVVGDSITEGFAVPDDARWTSQLRHDLQARFNPPATPGGEGFIPAYHSGRPASTDPGWVQRWSLHGFPTWSDSGLGLGRRALVIDTMSETASITVFGDRVWISYTGGPDHGLMRLLVDGYRPVLIDTHAAVTRSGRVWDSGPLPRGDHRVEVSDVLASKVVLDGITAFDGDGGPVSDQGRGIRMWEGGHSGYQSAHFGGPGPAYWTQGFDNIAPDLVIIELGANDQSVGVSPDLFRGYLERMVDAIRAQGTTGGGAAPSVALMPVWAASNRSEVEWERYRAAMYAVATGKGCAVLDVWSSLHQAPAKRSADGMFFDTVHLNLAGNRWLGDLVAHLIA